MKTLGEFYREKVLTYPRLTTRMLPDGSDGVEIVKELFGWTLIVNGRKVACRSEEEARFLKVYLEAGMMEISVPADDDYLRQILPELERLKARTDEIIESNLSTILNRKVRERLRQMVYAKLLE
ncbi:MAG: hypothetical protein ABIK44_06910 [candidate division WOR-3 bacterium]